MVDSGNKGEQNRGGENLERAVSSECPWADAGQIRGAGAETFQSDF